MLRPSRNHYETVTQATQGGTAFEARAEPSRGGAGGREEAGLAEAWYGGRDGQRQAGQGRAGRARGDG